MKKRYVWTTAVLVYVLFVFANSLKPADLSSLDSGAALRLVKGVLDALGADNTWITEHIIRKTAHFGEYTVYGILLFQCFSSYHMKLGQRIPTQALAGFLAPFTDETIQLFVEGRSGQISDVWLDLAGVAFGTIIAGCVCIAAGKIREGKREK